MTNRLRFSVQKASEHLRKADPVIARLIDDHGPYLPRPSMEPYEYLVRTILFQQLAGSAASAIQQRFYKMHGDETATPTAQQILETTDEAFRSVGVSRQKASYLRDLALHIVNGELKFEQLDECSDDEISEHLTVVKGIGEWSAHMFLMFQLGRPNVLPTGDLGIRAGMRIAYELKEIPSPQEARAIGEPWAPYRSVASWYMWRAVETLP